jgi:hypothetical protein
VSDSVESRFRDLQEVQERVPTSWSVRQRDALDRATSFIYSATSLADVLRQSREALLDEQSTSYAQHRWKNFVRHDVWLDLLYAEFPGCRPFENIRDRTKDLYVPVGGAEVIFDLKVTRWPSRLDRAASLPDVARWMYDNQSQQQRFHLDNRLFVVGDPEGAVCRYDLALATVKQFRRDAADFVFTLKFESGSAVAGVLLVRP